MKTFIHEDGQYGTFAYVEALDDGTFRTTMERHNYTTGESYPIGTWLSTSYARAIDSLDGIGDFEELESGQTEAKRTAHIGKSFVSAKRRFSLSEKTALIDEDKDDFEDDDLWV